MADELITLLEAELDQWRPEAELGVGTSPQAKEGRISSSGPTATALTDCGWRRCADAVPGVDLVVSPGVPSSIEEVHPGLVSGVFEVVGVDLDRLQRRVSEARLVGRGRYSGGQRQAAGW